VSLDEQTIAPSTRTIQPAFPGASRAQNYIETADIPPLVTAPADDTASVDQSTSVDAAKPVNTGGADLGRLSTAVDAGPARTGWRGRLGRIGLALPPSTAEKAAVQLKEQREEDERIIRQTTWTRAVGVLVANPKGGVGKTPTALILGGILAAIRGGSVCVMEVSDDPGALTFRSEGSPRLGIGELARDTDAVRSAGQLAGYTAPQTSFAAVLGTVGTRAQLTADDVTALSALVDDYYAIRIMDSGNQPSSSAFHGAVQTADLLVIPVLNAGDAALEAIALLAKLRAMGGRAARIADRAIIVRSSDGRPESPRVVDRVDQILADAGITDIHTIPYDSHIAERGEITLDKLHPATRDAFTAAAATAIRTLAGTVR
jgi:MinD-like ATPase involved in chromosome partitioning or flagellar assembly